MSDLKIEFSNLAAHFKHQQEVFITKREQMSVRNLQNEKIVEEVINRLTTAHGVDAT
tara:strand:+ start:326 stop:496 length:171 start_codon:yes stop_codon:yes gene_type:complete